MGEKLKISATLKVSLKPWTAPNFSTRADRQEGAEASSIHVSDLDSDALENMALAWVRELYTKAGRTHCPFYKPAHPALKAEP